MTGLIAAGIAGSVLAAGATMYASKKSGEAADKATGVAQQNSEMQQMLQQMQMQQQREMQTATQTDVNGNKLIYDPERGWIPLLSKIGLEDQAATQAAKEITNRNFFGRGQWEEGQDARRRMGQGRAADELLDAIRYGYGAPTKEGVTGANKIAAVTGVSDATDALKSGAAAAQLRTNSGAGPLQKQFESTDRSAATGVRSALAQTDATAGPLYNQIKADWRNNLAAGYGKLAPTAGQSGAPQATSGALDAAVASRAARPMAINPYSGMGSNTATQQLIAAMGAQGKAQPNYGAAIGSLTDQIKEGIKEWGGGSKSTTPWNQDSRNDAAYNSWRF